MIKILFPDSAFISLLKKRMCLLFISDIPYHIYNRNTQPCKLTVISEPHVFVWWLAVKMLSQKKSVRTTDSRPSLL